MHISGGDGAPSFFCSVYGLLPSTVIYISWDTRQESSLVSAVDSLYKGPVWHERAYVHEEDNVLSV